MRVLLIEDDVPTAALIRRALECARLETDTAADGEGGLRTALDGSYGLIILDLMLPRMDGMSVCRTLRQRRNTVPVLMLTARDAVDDRVRGLEAGADDFLAKPFDLQELVARARSLMRRDRVHRTQVIRIADLQIDTLSGTVLRAGRRIPLTPREYTLLEALAAYEGRVLDRETILERVWMDDESLTDTVKVHMASLRRKIDAEHAVKLIHTVRGHGYLLRAPQNEEPAGAAESWEVAA